MRSSVLGVAAALAAILCALPVQAHLVAGTRSLRESVAQAELVIRARVLETSGVAGRSSENPGVDRPYVEVEVIEVLKGRHEGDQLRFVQHGHGVAQFEAGREHLIFLVDVARSRELDVLAEAGTHRWLSVQEHEDAYPIDGANRQAVLAATRAYVTAETAPTAQARSEALRQATRLLLESRDARAGASALRDLVMAPSEPLLGAEDVKALEAVLDDPLTPIGVRVALLTELERRALVDADARWLAFLADTTKPRDRVVAIRAAGLTARPKVRARLVVLLGDPHEEVAAAAAAALGRPGDDGAVAPLAAALSSSSARVRNAAVRGLGKTRTEAALQALEAAGANHPDPTTRRLAAAEARKRRAAAAATAARPVEPGVEAN